jgi:ribosomal-protein-alanine N-acetyltransferase
LILDAQFPAQVHLATAADIPALIELERQCPTAAHWSDQQYEQLFRNDEGGPRRLVLVVEGGAETPRVLGFMIANRIGPEWELENIVVAPAVRKQHLGSRLLAELLLRAHDTNSEAIFLEVRESNVPARALYQRLSFVESGRRKSYYANPAEDAILYRRNLS